MRGVREVRRVCQVRRVRELRGVRRVRQVRQVREVREGRQFRRCPSPRSLTRAHSRIYSCLNDLGPSGDISDRSRQIEVRRESWSSGWGGSPQPFLSVPAGGNLPWRAKYRRKNGSQRG